VVSNFQTYPAGITLRDSRGWTSNIRWWTSVDVASGTAVSDVETINDAVIAAIQGLTNAATVRFYGLFNLNNPDPASYGGTGQFSSVIEKALMTFQDAGGKIHRWRIPAPLAAIFQSDLTTVTNDGSQAAVVAYVAAMKATSNSAFVGSRATTGVANTSQLSLPLTHFIGGRKIVTKSPRRLNTFIKSSGLVQGEGW